MSEFDQTDELEAEVEAEALPDEEEYVGEDPGVVSTDTGTAYDEGGEAETTPRDLDDAGEDDE